MMLFNLSFKNIKKSFKDYAIYFFTLILGVAIFYIFNSIESQTVLLNVTSTTHDLIELMNQMLSGVSIFVSFILGFLIIFASRFLMKRRNKEFGIYMTLGMGKGKISKILIVETLIAGVISLVIGLGLGIMLSQLMSVFVANLFEADMTRFTFIFSKSALYLTLAYFSIIYLIVMIFNTISVSKCKLIDLLYANKKSETVKMKNPILCIIVFLLGAGILGYAYYMVTIGITHMMLATSMIVPIAMGCVGTLFVTWSLSGLILKIFMSMKKNYYKGLNSFTLRQISSKINTTVISMSLICIMLFCTICILSSALSLKNSMTANLTELAPVDLNISKNYDLDHYAEANKISQIAKEDSKLTILESIKKSNFDFSLLTDIITFNTYRVDGLTFQTTLGDAYSDAYNKYPYVRYNVLEDLIRVSDYNKLAEFYHLPQYHINDNEYIIVADFESSVEVRNMGLQKNIPITILSKTYYPKYQEVQNGFLDMAANHVNYGFIIVPDDAVDETVRARNYLAANYNGNSKEEKKIIEEKIVTLNHQDYFKDLDFRYYNFNTKQSIYEACIGLGAMVTFIGLYLGIIFLISSAAILALKELSESADNKERYKMLRKIGTDEKMIHKALFRQIAIFFLFPLIFAIIHSIFGIQFCAYILETFGNQKLLASIVMTAAFLIVIYGGYFLITYWCSKNIIKE